MRRLAPIVIACALTLTSCILWRGPHRIASEDERASMSALVAAWVDMGRPAPGPACAVLDHVEIVTAPDVDSPCWLRTSQTERELASACVVLANRWPGAPVSTNIHLTEELGDQASRYAVVHEVAHVLRWCVLEDSRLRNEHPAWAAAQRSPPQNSWSEAADDHHRDAELWAAVERVAAP